MFKKLVNFFLSFKDDVRLVHQEEISIRVGKDSYMAYFTFYESRRGKRSYRFSTTYPPDVIRNHEFIQNRLPYTHTVLRPWLDGKYFPDIPSYNDVPKEEMISRLSGRP